MNKRVFAVVDKIEKELNSDENGVVCVPIGSIVEVVLGKEGGLDEFVLADSSELLPISYKDKTYIIYKDYLKDFWIV